MQLHKRFTTEQVTGILKGYQQGHLRGDEALSLLEIKPATFYKLLKKNSTRNLRLHADPFMDRHSLGADPPSWRGTVVGVDITLDQTEEFSRLLDAIRETYSSAVRERRKKRFKRPRFS